MAVSPARAAAFDILLRVERESSFASELLHAARFSHLASNDHGLATELVMGVLRWRSLLDERLASVSSLPLERVDAEVLTALRLGIYQLQFLSKVPARAAIFESVELAKQARKRSAASFVNAVLRKVGGKSEGIAAVATVVDALELSAKSAHPEWLVKRWTDRFGFEAARTICVYDQSVPETAIQIAEDQVVSELEQAGIRLAPGKLLSAARRVRSGDVTKTSAYKEGRISIQDEASQLVGMLVGRGKSILDCCAAPGGKTSILALRNPRGRVLASDVHPRRARLLRRLARQSNIQVVAADACQLPFDGGFDRILADVPCSGTGTLAHNPEIKWRLQPEDLLDLQMRQIAILQSALKQLAPGGRLVYSTCSLEQDENESVVEAALAEASDFGIADCRGELEQLRQLGELVWDDLDSLVAGGFLRTLPGVLACDGFFAAIIERTG